MSSDSTSTPLGLRFGRHVPKVLRRQLIAQLVESYLCNKKPEEEKTNCSPSFQRFHGAMLFVDISGFTALSLRLTVEELKNHINEYFTKMLDIVDKHGGDVIKFAGDALYIIWPIDLPPTPINAAALDVAEKVSPAMFEGIKRQPSKSHLTLSRMKSNVGREKKDHDNIHNTKDITKTKEYKEQYKIVLDKAVRCGAEITVACGNHKVIIDPTKSISPHQDNLASGPGSLQSLHSHQASTSMLSKLLPPMSYFTVNSKATPQLPVLSGDEKTVAYLNVHSGVSMGLMAGIDVGASDRWEYFLVGEPLTSVATAEGLANTGDVILCPESHAILHPPQPTTTSAAAMIRRNSLVIRRSHSQFASGSGTKGLVNMLNAISLSNANINKSINLGTASDSVDQNTLTDAGLVNNNNSESGAGFGAVPPPSISSPPGINNATESPGGNNNNHSSGPSTVRVLPCGCTPVGTDGYVKVNCQDFCLPSNNPTKTSKLATKLVAQLQMSGGGGGGAQSDHSHSHSLKSSSNDSFKSENGMHGVPPLFDNKLLDDIKSDIEHSFKSNKHLFRRCLAQYIRANPPAALLKYSKDHSRDMNDDDDNSANTTKENSASLITAGNKSNNSSSHALLVPQTVAVPHALVPPSVNINAIPLTTSEMIDNIVTAIVEDKSLKQHYSTWVNFCLIDDMARHVHEVARSHYVFKNLPRNNVLKSHLEIVLSLFDSDAIIHGVVQLKNAAAEIERVERIAFNNSMSSKMMSSHMPFGLNLSSIANAGINKSNSNLNTSANAGTGGNLLIHTASVSTSDAFLLMSPPSRSTSRASSQSNLNITGTPTATAAAVSNNTTVSNGVSTPTNHTNSILASTSGSNVETAVNSPAKPLLKDALTIQHAASFDEIDSLNATAPPALGSNAYGNRSIAGSFKIQPLGAGGSKGSFSNLLQGKSRLKSVALHIKTTQKMQNTLHSKKQRRSVMTLSDNDGLSAEIRNVIVMFVKLEITNMELLVDHHGTRNNAPGNGEMNCNYFNFASRTVNERQSDLLLLERLQDCIGILAKAFYSKEGQLRQFIVDDKGTVCIGTFGLRGSVSDDNAAAAIETAKMIVIQLQNIGLRASIGITSGKSYCGLVGSTKRHEYAVMGPSTNLSARLMCKAPPCGIICDRDTRNRDRTHEFTTLADVVAKGYAEPVGTYKPNFKDVYELTTQEDNHAAVEAYSKVVAKLNLRSSFDEATFMRKSFFQDYDPAMMQLSNQNSSVGDQKSSGLFGALTRMLTSSKLSPGDSSQEQSPVHTYRSDMNTGGPTSGSPKHRVYNKPTDGASLFTNNAGVTKIVRMDTNNTAIGEYSHPVIKRIMKSTFYLKQGANKDSAQNNAMKITKSGVNRSLLHGRELEIKTILDFLLLPLLLDHSNSVNCTPKSTVTKIPSFRRVNNLSVDVRNGGTDRSDPQLKCYFDNSQPTRMCSLYGPQGIGKDGIVNAITMQLSILGKQDKYANIMFIRNSTSNFHLNVPFHAWKTIFRELMSRVYHHLVIPKQTPTSSTSGGAGSPRAANKITNKNAKAMGVSSGMYEVLTGLDHLLSLMPESMRLLRPLIAAISFIPPEADNEVTSALKGQEKVNKTSDLLCAVLQMYPIAMKTLVLLALSDIQAFDIPSLQLMHQIWSQNTGFVFLTSCRSSTVSAAGQPKGGTHSRTQSEDGGSSMNGSIKGGTGMGPNSEKNGGGAVDNTSQLWQYIQSIQDPERLLHLEIDYLDRTAVEALVKDALLQSGITQYDQATIDKIYEVSGGNPLYAYELTKAITEHTSDQIVVDIDELSKVISTFRNNRIEEVICHRFDQLNIASQTVLKMAAVACSNNAHVTFELLSFILNDDDSEEDGFNTGRGFAAKSPGVNGLTNGFALHPITTINEDEDDEESTTHSFINTPGKSGRGATSGKATKLSDINLATAIYEILCSNEFIHAIMDEEGSFDTGENTGVGASFSVKTASSKRGSMSSRKNSLENSLTTNSRDTSMRKSSTDQLGLMNDLLKAADIVQSNLIISNQYKYEFKILLEQHIIYDLLLDDQKHLIHERIALYYHKVNIDYALNLKVLGVTKEEVVLLQAAQYYEEGYHWQHASEWHSAISCYYQAAKALKPFPQYIETRKQYLASAYTLCKVTYHYQYHISDNYFENQSTEDELLSLIKQANETKTKETKNGKENTKSYNNDNHSLYHNKSLSKMPTNIETDEEMLYSVLQIHIQLAQLCTVLHEESLLVMTIYHDVIHILFTNLAERENDNLLVSRQPFRMALFAILSGYIEMHALQAQAALTQPVRQLPVVHEVPASDGSVITTNTGDSAAMSVNTASHIHVTIPPGDNFTLPSGGGGGGGGSVAIQGATHSGSRPSMIHKVNPAFMIIAKKYLILTAPEEPVHHIQALIQLIVMYCNTGKKHETAHLVSELKTKYQEDSHSSELLEVYGKDGYTEAVEASKA